LLVDVRSGINVGVMQATKADKTADAEKWRRWIADNIESGAKNAHKFLSLPEEWQPTVLPDADGIHSSSPPKLLEAYRRKYDGLWNRRSRAIAEDGRGGSDSSPPCQRWLMDAMARCA
jgi:hypothetical protein